MSCDSKPDCHDVSVIIPAQYIARLVHVILPARSFLETLQLPVYAVIGSCVYTTTYTVYMRSSK